MAKVTPAHGVPALVVELPVASAATRVPVTAKALAVADSAVGVAAAVIVVVAEGAVVASTREVPDRLIRLLHRLLPVTSLLPPVVMRRA